MASPITFDTHVAAQGINELVHNTLLDLGFQDDGLIDRYVSMIDGKPVSSCPLIGIHMSKKSNSKTQSLSDLAQTKNLLEQNQMIGYGHSEITLARHTLSSEKKLYREAEPSFHPLHPSPSNVDKKWDIHIAIPHAQLEQQVKDLMQYYGFDWIDLKKPKQEPYRVYSAQGICDFSKGKKLYTSIIDWLTNMNIPQAKCKLECYVDMYRLGNPEIVPPVVNEVLFL